MKLSDILLECLPTHGRPPRGGRGLKSALSQFIPHRSLSPPSRGAWIEIHDNSFLRVKLAVAPLAGGVD